MNSFRFFLPPSWKNLFVLHLWSLIFFWYSRVAVFFFLAFVVCFCCLYNRFSAFLLRSSVVPFVLYVLCWKICCQFTVDFLSKWPGQQAIALVLESLSPYWRHKMCSWLLASPWTSPNHCSNLGVMKQDGRVSVSSLPQTDWK